MTFQASDKKEHQFLELLNNDNKPLELTYSKCGSWLKYFGHSTSLCMRATRAIVNHAPIGKLSGAVHTGVEVHRMDSEMSGLVERPWLQLMCCAVCLPHGRNFR